jgi:hypothetical protein
MKNPEAQTLINARRILSETPHRSVRQAEGQAHVFVSANGPALVTREDARRLLNLGLVRMERLTDADGWKYVPSGIGQYNHIGEHHAALATFDSIHRDPAIRHRFGQYHPAPVLSDDKAVVSVWQDPGKSVQTTSYHRKGRKEPQDDTK